MVSIKLQEIEEILGFQIERDLQKKIENLYFENLSTKESDGLILKNVDFLLKENVVVSGDHRIDDWDNGWRENLEIFRLTKKLDDLVPKYHSKYNYLRWKGDFIKSKSERQCQTRTLTTRSHTQHANTLSSMFAGEHKAVVPRCNQRECARISCR